MPKVSLLNVGTTVGHTSQGLNLTGRELVTADELMRWPQDTVLVWQAGYPPAKLPLPDLSQWSIFPDLQERQPFIPGRPEPDPLFGAGDAEGAATGRDHTDEEKGGDPPMTEPTPDIAIDDLGPYADLFANQTLPIDGVDEPPFDA